MKPETWAEIRRLHHVEKRSIRQIAGQLKLNFRTVRRALKHENTPPPTGRTRSSILDAFQKDFDELLAETPTITAVRMQEELERRGFKGKQTVVKDRLRSIRDGRKREAFIRRVFHPGEAAEVDWASCGSVELGGRKRNLSCFVMTLCYSRMIFLKMKNKDELNLLWKSNKTFPWKKIKNW